MRKDVNQVMITTFNATFIATLLGGIGCGIISPFVSSVFTGGDGMGAYVLGIIAMIVLGAFLSPTIAFAVVTETYITSAQAVRATIAYGVAIVLASIAIVTVPMLLILLLNSIPINIPESWYEVALIIGLVVLVALPSIIATYMAKIIYPRFAVPMQAQE